MIVLWIALGAVALLIVACIASDGKSQSLPPASEPSAKQATKPAEPRKTVSDFVAARKEEKKTPPSKEKKRIRHPEKPKVEIKDLHIEPGLLVTAQEGKRNRIQVLGACYLRGCIPDRVVAGTVFKIEDRDDAVWVMRDNGMTVGTLPPNVASQYHGMPEGVRYKRVVVARDFDFNDKYGQCFVYPVFT